MRRADGRIKLSYDVYNKHLHLIASCKKIGEAEIVYQRSCKTYDLIVSMELETPDIDPMTITRVSGVDVGRRYLAVETDLQKKSKCYSGKEARHKANRYQKARKTLCKGTRSTARRLIATSGRERRFTADLNHTISKQIANPNSLIGLENLTGIRDRIKSRTGKRASKKPPRANCNKAKWSFAELHGYIDYKADLNGSMATKVPARYTSQSCVKCGHTSKANRPNKGLLFRCECCGYELLSDLLGNRNIALRTLLVRQDWMSTGTLSMCP